MRTVGLRELKNHLSENVRRVRSGERILITFHGEVVAELRPPEATEDGGAAAGLRELVSSGLAHGAVDSTPQPYRSYERAVADTRAQDLLDWDRGER